MPTPAKTKISPFAKFDGILFDTGIYAALTTTHVKALGALLRFGGAADAQMYPKRDTLKKLTGMNVDTLSYTLGSLAHIGLLRTIRRRRSNGHKAPVEYRLADLAANPALVDHIVKVLRSKRLLKSARARNRGLEYDESLWESWRWETTKPVSIAPQGPQECAEIAPALDEPVEHEPTDETPNELVAPDCAAADPVDVWLRRTGFNTAQHEEMRRLVDVHGYALAHLQAQWVAISEDITTKRPHALFLTRLREGSLNHAAAINTLDPANKAHQLLLVGIDRWMINSPLTGRGAQKLRGQLFEAWRDTYEYFYNGGQLDRCLVGLFDGSIDYDVFDWLEERANDLNPQYREDPGALYHLIQEAISCDYSLPNREEINERYLRIYWKRIAKLQAEGRALTDEQREELWEQLSEAERDVLRNLEKIEEQEAWSMRKWAELFGTAGAATPADACLDDGIQAGGAPTDGGMDAKSDDDDVHAGLLGDAA